MKPIYKVSLLMLIVMFSGNCSRLKALPPHAQCDKDITQVSHLLKTKSIKLDKSESRRIHNLVKAAKIQQQHGDFITCVDIINRGLTLLKKDKMSITEQKKN